MTDTKLHRRTALVVAAVLGAVALRNLYRGHMTAVMIFGSVSAVLTIVGLWIAPAAAAFHKSWMGLAHVLGYINTRILLTVMYFGVITPMSLVARVFGRDPLQRRAAGAASYWIRRPQTRQPATGFEKSF